MQAQSAGLAIALLLSGAGHAQAREVVAPKAAVKPAATVKAAPQVLPANAIQPAHSTAEQRAYSDMVDQVAKSVEDFADDNTSENQGRDHLGDPPADAATNAADGKAPVTTKKGRRP